MCFAILKQQNVAQFSKRRMRKFVSLSEFFGAVVFAVSCSSSSTASPSSFVNPYRNAQQPPSHPPIHSPFAQLARTTLLPIFVQIWLWQRIREMINHIPYYESRGGNGTVNILQEPLFFGQQQLTRWNIHWVSGPEVIFSANPAVIHALIIALAILGKRLVTAQNPRTTITSRKRSACAPNTVHHITSQKYTQLRELTIEQSGPCKQAKSSVENCGR